MQLIARHKSMIHSFSYHCNGKVYKLTESFIQYKISTNASNNKGQEKICIRHRCGTLCIMVNAKANRVLPLAYPGSENTPCHLLSGRGYAF